jgi:cytochrome oxidase Cu insertion factor (SCO1/SenC/PrrC family)
MSANKRFTSTSLLLAMVLAAIQSQGFIASAAAQAGGMGARSSTAGGSTSTLKVGDAAPDFELPDQAGKTVRLSDFKGKKNVVLAFYVLAFTGG